MENTWFFLIRNKNNELIVFTSNTFWFVILWHYKIFQLLNFFSSNISLNFHFHNNINKQNKPQIRDKTVQIKQHMT